MLATRVRSWMPLLDAARARGQVGQTVCVEDTGYGLEQAQPITSGSLAALRVLHRRV